MKKWSVKSDETPLEDLSGLKLKIVSPTREQVERFEAMNIAKAREKYFIRKITPKRAPFDLSWLMKLHKEMFGDVWEWAGKFRTTNTSIGVDKHQIHIQLGHLLDDLCAWQGMDLTILEQATRLHHRAVQIHPFENGNGRWARMLCDIWLRKNGENAIKWPVTVEKESPIRLEYISALKAADDMDETPLLELHKRYWFSKN